MADHDDRDKKKHGEKDSALNKAGKPASTSAEGDPMGQPPGPTPAPNPESAPGGDVTGTPSEK